MKRRGESLLRSGRPAARASVQPNAEGFSDGFAAPIIWGVKLGFQLSDIAAGLELDERVVRAVIESRSPVRFPTGRFSIIEVPRALTVWERAA
jgi:hypothetical protein